MIFRIFAVLISLLAAGCSGAQVLNTLSSGSGTSVSRGVSYGDLPRQKYDVYRPDSPENAPVIVFFYGGGWDSGQRGSYQFVGNALAGLGYTVAIPDYRVYPQAQFPKFVEDGAKAVASIRRDVAGGRPIVLMGHSAGAQIAALLALDGRYLGAQGLSPCRAVSAFVGLSGPYDFLPLDEERYKRIFPKQLRPQSQPINYAGGRHPPSLLLHGKADTTVEPKDSTILAAALRKSGNSARAILYDGIGHAELVGTLARVLGALAPTTRDIDDFLHDTAGRSGC